MSDLICGCGFKGSGLGYDLHDCGVRLDRATRMTAFAESRAERRRKTRDRARTWPQSRDPADEDRQRFLRGVPKKRGGWQPIGDLPSREGGGDIARILVVGLLSGLLIGFMTGYGFGFVHGARQATLGASQTVEKEGIRNETGRHSGL